VNTSTAVSTLRRLLASALMLGFILFTATSQNRGGAQEATSLGSFATEAGTPGFTYRNDISVRAGAAWQTLFYQNLFSPDEHVIDRCDWSSAVRFTHVFTDLRQDDTHRHDVSRRLQPASHVDVELSDRPTLAMEPDEFRLRISGAGLLAPGFALGGSITDVEGERSLYWRYGRKSYPETVHTTMFTAIADIWLSPRVVLRESVGGGRYTRRGSTWLGLPDDGGVLAFGHELCWEISPVVSYAHTLRVDNWEDCRRVLDFNNTVEIAFAPEVVGTVGLRMAGFYTREVYDDVALGTSIGIRVHPVPYLYAGASASSVGIIHIFERRDQQEFLLAVGTRF
jgi:hypothetical protein